MDNPKPLDLKIEADDFIKLAHLDVLEDLIKVSADRAIAAESKEVEDLAETVADVYRDLFVKAFLDRYNKQVSTYFSLIDQTRR